MELEIIPSIFSICRLEPNSAIPSWALAGLFSSITKTNEELSIVCEQINVPNEIKSEMNWSCLRIKGKLDFKLTGVLSNLIQPLKDIQISVFVVSTYDTDYILIKKTDLEKAKSTLIISGNKIID